MKPIVVGVTRATDDWPKGAELGFANAADADKVLGDGNYKILRHTDSSAYEPPKAEPKAPADEKAK